MRFAEGRARLQNAVFATLGEDAVWAGTIPCRVRVMSEDDTAPFGSGSRLIVTSLVVRVRQSEVPDPRIDDEIGFPDGRVLRVTSDPMIDANGVWACTVAQVA